MMGDESTNVSLVALVVAAAALVIASGQLLQQLFGTAEGYRRCQLPVMGAWSKLTYRKWHWREFRFETRYQTPHILLLRSFGIQDGEADNDSGRKMFAISGTPESMESTMTPAASRFHEKPESVSWLALIQQLQELQGRFLMPRHEMRHYIGENRDVAEGDKEEFVSGFYDIRSSYNQAGPQMFENDKTEISNMNSPAIERREWSWDLIPPDIHRPLATVNMGTLVTLAHRLGMAWTTLQPHEGAMRAEGNGQSLSATVIRGLGLVLQYNFDRSVHIQDQAEVVAMMRIPTNDADKMGFGIIPGNKKSFPRMWDIPLTSHDSRGNVDVKLLSAAMKRLDVLPEAIQSICDDVRTQQTLYRIPGFGDILGLWPDFMPLRSSQINSIIHPMGTRLESPFEAREGRVTFRLILQWEAARAEGTISQNQTWVLQQLQYLFNGFRNDFMRSRSLPRGNRLEDTKLVETLRRIFDTTTSWFRTLDKKDKTRTRVEVSIFEDSRARLRVARRVDHFYHDLVAAHISLAASAQREVAARLARGEGRDDGSILADVHDSNMVELAFVYAENAGGRLAAEMKRRGQIARLGYIDPAYLNEELVRDAWWMMMLRAVVWFMSNHRLEADEVQPVPSKLYESSTVIYIT